MSRPYAEDMTLREHYAGLAMAAIIANPAIDELDAYEVAQDARLFADALIEALNADESE